MILILLCVLVCVDGFSFHAFGDWGKKTADFRLAVARLHLFEPKPHFTVLLGDNFYEDGVSSVNDPLWELFRDIEMYSPKFFPVLGNHDYQQSIQPQIDYSKQSSRWIMPDTYYYLRLNINNGSYICGLFLDTFKFDQAQLRWVEFMLASRECQNDKVYRIVFTHYPIYTVGMFYNSGVVNQLVLELKPVLEKNRVHAYVAGHEHDMQVFIDNGIHYLIAGSITDKTTKKGNAVEDPHLEWRKVDTAGFLQFTLSDEERLTYAFIDNLNGKPIYENQIVLNNIRIPSYHGSRSSVIHVGSIGLASVVVVMICCHL